MARRAMIAMLSKKAGRLPAAPIGHTLNCGGGNSTATSTQQRTEDPLFQEADIREPKPTTRPPHSLSAGSRAPMPSAMQTQWLPGCVLFAPHPPPPSKRWLDCSGKSCAERKLRPEVAAPLMPETEKAHSLACGLPWRQPTMKLEPTTQV